MSVGQSAITNKNCARYGKKLVYITMKGKINLKSYNRLKYIFVTKKSLFPIQSGWEKDLFDLKNKNN